MSGSITIIKMGGALITDDSRNFTAKPDVIEAIADQIAAVFQQERGTKGLILLHGGGSFGHVHAAKYGLNSGYRSDLAPGLPITHDSMLELNRIVKGIFKKKGLVLLAFPPMAFCIMTKGRVTKSFCTPIEKAIELGYIPVLFGDVAFDTETGYKILSGDQLPVVIHGGMKGVDRVIFLTNVDGVYNKHPGINKDARLYTGIDVNKITSPADLFETSISTSDKIRVTGEMKKKVEELYPLARQGLECWIINSKQGRLKELLLTGTTLGTRLYRS